jgi:hypothetical protein
MEPKSALVKQIGSIYASRDHTAGEVSATVLNSHKLGNDYLSEITA